jgi:hypothetical protein
VRRMVWIEVIMVVVNSLLLDGLLSSRVSDNVRHGEGSWRRTDSIDEEEVERRVPQLESVLRNGEQARHVAAAEWVRSYF